MGEDDPVAHARQPADRAHPADHRLGTPAAENFGEPEGRIEIDRPGASTAKLGTSDRLGAVIRARDLGLLHKDDVSRAFAWNVRHDMATTRPARQNQHTTV